MNILEIAKECGATMVVDKFDVPFLTYDIAFDSEQLEAYTAEIAAKAIEDYKAKLELVAWYDKKLGAFDVKQFDQLEPLYLLPKKTK